MGRRPVLTKQEKREAFAKKREYMIEYMRVYNNRERSADLRGYIYDINGKLNENYQNYRSKTGVKSNSQHIK